MSSIPLRKTGLLVLPLKDSTAPAQEPPRALKSLAQIVDNGLCHRCGSCVGICPTKVLGLDSEDYPVVENLSSCTDCDLCVRVCPGDEFDVPSMAQEMFGEVPDIHDMHGHFEKAYLSYASEPAIRSGSTSGGLISGLLISLLERGIIDGAIVVSSDENVLWKGKPIVARTREEVLSAMKSKYAISPTNAMLAEICETEGRYALVGLPCQIHGFHKAARLNRKIRDRVTLTIGLFCHAAVEHEPMRYVFDKLIDPNLKATKFVSRIGKHPGTPHLVMEDGSMKPVYFPEAKSYRPSSLEILNIFYRLYTPSRCLTCYDSTSEFADIAVGDPWMAPPDETVDFLEGYSFALARTKKGAALLESAEESGHLSLREITPEHARSSNRMMGEEKRNRAFRIIESRRRQGLAIPEYGMPIPKVTGKELVKTEINMLSHLFCFVDKGRKAVLKVTFSPVGYHLLRANYYRREFRVWRRDMKFKLKQRKEAKRDLAPTGRNAE